MIASPNQSFSDLKERKRNMTKIRCYKPLGTRKRNRLQQTGGSPQIMGRKQETRRIADSMQKQKHLMHFGRCETSLASGLVARGHVYAKCLDHPFHVQQAKKGRIRFQCIFCGDETKTFNSKNPQHDITVSDVPNSDFVRKEAEIRRAPVLFYKKNQEVEN